MERAIAILKEWVRERSGSPTENPKKRKSIMSNPSATALKAFIRVQRFLMNQEFLFVEEREGSEVALASDTLGWYEVLLNAPDSTTTYIFTVYGETPADEEEGSKLEYFAKMDKGNDYLEMDQEDWFNAVITLEARLANKHYEPLEDVIL